MWLPWCTCAALPPPCSRLLHSVRILVFAPCTQPPARVPPFARISALTALGSALFCISLQTDAVVVDMEAGDPNATLLDATLPLGDDDHSVPTSND